MNIKTRTAYSLIIVLAVFVGLSFQQSDLELPPEVKAVMASKRMRYHHLFFHNLRQFWVLQTPEAQHKYERLGWKPPRISKAWNSQFQDFTMEDNDAGEDFFYMHLKMTEQFNKISTEAHSRYGKVVGFRVVPPPGDKKYPVPPAYTITVPGQEGFTALIENAKTDEFYWSVMKPEEDALNNPATLRGLTLGQLGARLEYGLHAWMHLRFSAASPLGYRIDMTTPTPRVDDQWDVPEYDWLVDFYASQVNPIFWKIHGWVNDKFEAWKSANNVREVYWKGTWQRGPWETLEELFDVVQPPPSPLAAEEPATEEAASSEEIDQDLLVKLVAKLLAEASKKD